MPVIETTDMMRHLNIVNASPDDHALIEAKIQAAEDWIALYIGVPWPDPPEDDDDPAPIPGPLKEAIRQLAAHLYENREASLVGITASALPFGLLDLLAPYRAWAF